MTRVAKGRLSDKKGEKISAFSQRVEPDNGRIYVKGEEDLIGPCREGRIFYSPIVIETDYADGEALNRSGILGKLVNLEKKEDVNGREGAKERN